MNRDLEDLRTLNALTNVEGTVVQRVYELLRVITALRQERPELWEEIVKFSKEKTQ